MLFHISGYKVRRLKKDAAPTKFLEFPENFQDKQKTRRCSSKKRRKPPNKTENSSTKIYFVTEHSCVPAANIEIKVEMEEESVDPLDITTSSQ
jgi:hypothetical protein